MSDKNSNAKVLVVEDDNFLKDLLGQQMSENSLNATYAYDGKQAIESLATEKPDLVMLDLRLPGQMDGFDVLEWIRQNERMSDLPVIVFSNYSEEENIEKAKSLNVEDYMVKSNYSLYEVIDKMKEVIEKYNPEKSVGEEGIAEEAEVTEEVEEE